MHSLYVEIYSEYGEISVHTGPKTLFLEVRKHNT